MYQSNRDALPIYQPSDGRGTSFGREPLPYRDNGDDRAQMQNFNPPRLPPISSLLSSLPPGQVEESQGFEESYRPPSQGPRSPLALDRPMYLHQQQRSPRELELSFKHSQSPHTTYSSAPPTPMPGEFANREGSVAAHYHSPFAPPRAPQPQPQPQCKLVVMQQPISARACGYGDKDRRMIDPPPILTLEVYDKDTGQEVSAKERKKVLSRFMPIVHCTLWNPYTNCEDDKIEGSGDRRNQRRMVGTMVCNGFKALDPSGDERFFFTFADLSVRFPGDYQLKFRLTLIDPAGMGKGQKNEIISPLLSNIFRVHNAKDFEGMRPSSDLAKSLVSQGYPNILKIKKGNAKTIAMVGQGGHDDEDDEDDEMGGM
ncbi:hypothetical protein DSL72_005055 [Monilinia vaccinii-corymbosi]|uniref:Velvet domain-containing protein n=1 Tax=Monilinia vaccinii-corymbosi TaxID=61207 RepID=A0A8A3PE55_9HELO|nr:hypothetical protein DSL72_005055 [Monilinia vaccinii-corymbosi]